MTQDPLPGPAIPPPEKIRELLEVLSLRLHELHYIQDHTGRMIYVSPSVQNLMGYSPTEYIEHWAEILDWNSPRTLEAQAIWKKSSASEPEVLIGPYLIDLKHRDGSRRTHEISERWYADETNQRFLLGIADDVTDRSIVESKFERVQELTGIVNYTGDITPEGLNTVYLGPSFERLFDVPREVVLKDSRAFMTNVHPEDIEELGRTVGAIFEGRGPDRWHLKYRVVHRDGSVHWISDRGVIERGLNGKPRRWIGLAEEITEQVLIEKEHLERDELMIRGQKLEAVGHLAGGVAHNFSNLLMAIQGYIDLAKRTLEPAHPAMEALSRIEETSDQARGITRSLLTFTRQQPVEHTPLNLSKGLESTARLLRRSLPARVRVHKQIDPGVLVLGDQSQLDQVVLNTAINARDSMPDGGSLTIRLTQSSHHALLTISDTGQGMDSATLNRVFDPFFTTKPADKGTGLGMSITRNIVHGHRGTIELDSEPGRGTSVKIVLPRVESMEYEPPTSLVVAAQHGNALLLHTPGLVRRVVTSMLQELGYSVIPVDSIDSARARLKNEEIRILLIDPDSDSSMTPRSIQALLDSVEDPSVVVLVEEPKRWKKLRLGPRGRLLLKPFMRSDLASALSAEEPG